MAEQLRRPVSFLGRSRARLTLGTLTVFLGVAGLVLLARHFSLLDLERVLARIDDPAVRAQVLSLVAGLTLPQWALLVLVGVMLFLGYRAGSAWTSLLRRWDRTLSELDAELERMDQDLEVKSERLYWTSVTDPLTEVYNRGFFIDALNRESGKSFRHHLDLACVMIDIDHFKRVNNRYGHEVGDRVLSAVARRIGDQLRHEDVLARYGGEEFAVMLPETGLKGARVVAEKIRGSFDSAPVTCDDLSIPISVSLGIATLGANHMPVDVDHLLKRTEDALLEAKRAGRNRVVAASP